MSTVTFETISVKRLQQLFSKITMVHCEDFPSSPCWLYTGKLNPDGYARVGRSSRGSNVMLHRLFYAWAVGGLPDYTAGGLTLDHLCRRRNCCNPVHLELVSHHENMLRSSVVGPRVTHCTRGHLYDDQNTRYKRDGTRYCGACHLEQARIRRVANVESVRAARQTYYRKKKADPEKWTRYLAYMREFRARVKEKS